MPGERLAPTGLLPRWLARLAIYAAAVLVVGAAAWVMLQVLLLVKVLTMTVLAAILLTALVQPIVQGLRAIGSPPWLAALGAVVFLLVLPLGVGYLVVSQAITQVDELRNALSAGIDEIRQWLVEGPLSLSPEQIDQIRNALVEGVQRSAPAPSATATLVLQALGSAIVALFLIFFLCKDGPAMWDWAVRLSPAQYRDRVDACGHVAWSTLSQYVTGTAVIALIDATAIGLGLLILGVPLALPLSLLVFIGAFVPLLGATISGAVAVAVALATQGFDSALITLVIVLAVQQIEGNLLQPLIMGHALHLHPTAILLSVTAGFLLAGIAGAVIAVPLVAVTYKVATLLRTAQPAREAENPQPAVSQTPPTKHA